MEVPFLGIAGYAAGGTDYVYNCLAHVKNAPYWNPRFSVLFLKTYWTPFLPLMLT